MPEHLKKLLQQVYSCDTKAGHRLRYIIMKALAYKPYTKHIHFLAYGERLTELFWWSETLEGWKYWDDIWNLLIK